MPGAFHMGIRLFDPIDWIHPIDNRTDCIDAHCLVKLILHFSAAHVNSVDRKTLPEDGQRVDEGVKSGQHANQADPPAHPDGVYGPLKCSAPAEFEDQIGADPLGFLQYRFFPIRPSCS